MVLIRQMAAAVSRLHAAGVRPVATHTTKHSSWRLRAAGDRGGGLILMQSGRLTNAGREYERISNTQLEDPESPFVGESFLVGRTAFVLKRMPGGGTRKVKISAVIDGKERIYSEGRAYYREHPTEYQIDVPVSKDVWVHRLQRYRHIEDTTVPLNWQTPMRRYDSGFSESAIAHTRAELGDGWNDSEVEYTVKYDAPLSEWHIMEKDNLPGRESRVLEYSLDQPLHAPDGRHSFTSIPSSVVDEALVGSFRNCVLTQLSARLNLDIDDLEGKFAKALHVYEEEGPEGEYPFGVPLAQWSPDQGITPRMIMAVCQALKYSCHGFWQDVKVMENLVPGAVRRGSLAFSFSNSHFNLFDRDVTWRLCQMSVSTANSPQLGFYDAWQLESRSKSKYSYDDYQDWRGMDPEAPPPVGHFWVESTAELLAIRMELLQRRRVSKLFLHSLNEPNGLKYDLTRREAQQVGFKCGGPHAVCHVRVLGRLVPFLAEAADKLKFEYRLEGLCSFAWRALRYQLRPPRASIPDVERLAVVQRQENQCNRCGVAFGEDAKYEIDHVRPLYSDVCSEGPSELQALCKGCHCEKTLEERGQQITLDSHLSDELWSALVEGAPASALVYSFAEPGKRSLTHVDRRASRMRILLESSYDWPVALPCDCVEPFDCEFGDFCYVEHGLQGRFLGTRFWNELEWFERCLPLRGNGWYHRSVVDGALRRGFFEDGTARATHVVRCSCRVPARRFGEALRRVLEALPEDGQVGNERPRRDACVKLVGLWGMRKRSIYGCTTSECPQDAQILARAGFSYRLPLDYGDWADFKSEMPQVSRHTLYLLHRAVIDMECALLADMVSEARGMTEARSTGRDFKLYQLNTDSVLYSGEALPESDALRVHHHTQEHRLTGEWKRPVRADPPPQACPEWRDVGHDDHPAQCESHRHVLAGGSLYIEALAGCGKSVMLGKLVAALRATGKTVQPLSVTHVAVANLQHEIYKENGDDGAPSKTLARYIHEYTGKRPPDAFAIDECSLIDPYIWAHMASILAHSKAQVILAGDWHQLPPVNRQFGGCEVTRGMRDAPFIKQICGFTRAQLLDCRRSDARLFNAYSSYAHAPLSTPLNILVEAARISFPPIPGEARVNLVACHQARIRLNARLMRAFCPATGWVEVQRASKCYAQHNKPQTMLVWPDCELICATKQRGYRNSWTYVVAACDHETVTITESGSDVTIKLCHDKLSEYMRPCWARTYHSAQGLGWTCHETIAMIDAATRDVLSKLWDEGGRYLSVNNFVAKARRQGVGLTRQEAIEFLGEKGPRSSDVYKEPKIEGKAFAAHEHSEVKVDLMDRANRPSKAGYRYILVAVNSFSREMWVEPLMRKIPQLTSAAFAKILDRMSKNPEMVRTDQGLEWLGSFDALLKEENIIRTDKEKQDWGSFAVLDRAIGTLKRIIAQRTEDGQDWGEILQAAARQYNDSPHTTTGTAPDEVEENPVARFHIKKQNAEALEHNLGVHAKRRAALEEAGGFRRRQDRPQNGWRADTKRMGPPETLGAGKDQFKGNFVHPAGGGKPTLLKWTKPFQISA